MVPSVVSEKKQVLLKHNLSHQLSRLGGGACLTPLAGEEAERKLRLAAYQLQISG